MSGGPSSSPEYPPLLGAGFHPVNLESLKELCVAPFSSSDTREDIMSGLESLLAILRDSDITGELWIDGSFLTSKIDPKDVDIVLRLEPNFIDEASDEQVQTIDWFGDNRSEDYRCDSYVFIEYPKGHDLEGEGEWDRAYWIRQFGFSRREDHKGITVLTL